MQEILLTKSKAKNKKFAAIVKYSDGKKKTVNFGDDRYEDFTMHKDEERKKKYKLRHQNDMITNITKPGFYSWFLLWNKPTLQESIRDTEEKFNLKISTSL